MILVAPRSRVEAVLAETRPARLVSLASPGAEPFVPREMAEADRLHLVMNDIAEDRPGLVSPKMEQVEALLAFARGWDPASGPLLVHCHAGVSRSTAAAFVVMAALRPERVENELASELRRLSPSATPNPFLVRLADSALGRDGRMIAAIRAIGRGAECFEGAPFRWSLDP